VLLPLDKLVLGCCRLWPLLGKYTM